MDRYAIVISHFLQFVREHAQNHKIFEVDSLCSLRWRECEEIFTLREI